MDADGRLLAVRAQMQMRIRKTHRKQRDCCHPQCGCPFAAEKHGRSMPESVFVAIGTEPLPRGLGQRPQDLWRLTLSNGASHRDLSQVRCLFACSSPA